MLYVNKIMISGNLTRDPELRYTPGGAAIIKFSVATNRRYKSQDGEPRKEVCYFDVTMFGKRAEVINKYFIKGSPIYIEGRMKYEQWEDSAGNKRNRLVVIAENFEFAGSAKDGNDHDEAQQHFTTTQQYFTTTEPTGAHGHELGDSRESVHTEDVGAERYEEVSCPGLSGDDPF